METHLFDEAGGIPNSPLPLLVCRSALPADAAAIERAFAGRSWGNAWRNGIFDYHHFHSIAHEALGVARGTARVMFGGPGGRAVSLAAGDLVVIPAGVGHCRIDASSDLLVVGAYPGGGNYDIRRDDPAEIAAMRARVAAVPRPDRLPLPGLEAGWD